MRKCCCRLTGWAACIFCMNGDHNLCPNQKEEESHARPQ